MHPDSDETRRGTTVHASQGGQESSADAFTREVIRNKLLAIASEMGIVLARTSMSPIVYEVLDFACGITDAEARVIAQYIVKARLPCRPRDDRVRRSGLQERSPAMPRQHVI